MVICGDQDEGTPPDRNKLIASKIPGGRYEGIAQARHLPNVERPEQFNKIMMGWLGLNR
jgi:3-oxoadipate enol-lactonase